uniref:Cytochrome c-553 n=1 Tax=Chaetoceros debilis TaxID=122233 RepID=A0A7S3PYW0_9STRA|eukprot:CAMPEP_0194072532 /NCGR_PEP_ID=MMETSP0149-20130528/257_1 /TAXON_ID=122233 /ORGANISM="Chaetoceros debilis, Strain MM31A-1" /LENGTH=133 /DNA_ID=CAMNT_0038752425 /DNA_START=11 /DNA_END=412 /DNA_ORIENTATION=-
MKLAIIATLAASASAFSVNPGKAAQAAGVAAVIAASAAAPAFAGSFDSGETIFNGNCAACHAGGQNVIAGEKTLEKEALDQYLAGGRSEASVMKQVTNGKAAMPAFGDRLDADQIADVATYVISMSEKGWDDE